MNNQDLPDLGFFRFKPVKFEFDKNDIAAGATEPLRFPRV